MILKMGLYINIYHCFISFHKYSELGYVLSEKQRESKVITKTYSILLENIRYKLMFR